MGVFLGITIAAVFALWILGFFDKQKPPYRRRPALPQDDTDGGHCDIVVRRGTNAD